ncbi:MAG: DMT family transporter [archaeon]|nr:DMT family transporter [archaeon]
MEKNGLAYLFVFLAVLLWGSTAAVSKLLLFNISNIQLMLFSSFFAAIALFLISVIRGKLTLISSYGLKDYWVFAYMGLLGVFLYGFFFFGAIDLLAAQEAFIINYLWPLMIILFAVPILKEKLTFAKILGIIFSFFGVIIVISKGNIFSLNFGNIVGVIFAILGAIVYGFFSVLGKKHDYDRLTSMTFYYLFGFAYTFIFATATSQLFLPNASQLLSLLWLGIFTSGLAFLFWFLALKYADTAKMSNIVYLTPFVSLVYIYFLVGEQILLSSIIGLVIIIIGVIIQTKNK